MIKVSIIIPTYKRGLDLVKRAIDSVLNQTYENIEIVLVDDNAKPEHIEFREIVEKFVSDCNNRKIVYVQNEENLGGSLSRNAGIENSTGEYITFLDDDDRYLPEKIEKQLQFMLENDLEMSFTDLSIHNEKDKLIDYREYSKIKSFDNDYLMRYHLTRQISGTPTFMLTKDTLKKINGFDDACMGQEYYLMSKIIQSNAKIGYMPSASYVVAYRYDIEAISTGPNKIRGQKALYDYKRSFFDILTYKERKFVRCRHHAVMGMAYKRNKKVFKAMGELILAIIVSPLNAIKEAFSLIKRIKKEG